MINVESSPHNEEQEEPIISPQLEAEPQKVEVISEAGAELGLERQDKALQEAEKVETKQNKHAMATLYGWRKWVGTALLLGSPLVTTGCNSSEKPPRPDNSPKSEQRINDESKEIFEKDRAFLSGVLQGISGGGMGKAENGDLIVHTGGGHYYELQNQDLDKLMKTADTYRRRIERAEHSKGMKAFVLKLKEATDMAIRANIVKMGRQMSLEQLPQNLKEYEEGRRQIIKDMDEVPNTLRKLEKDSDSGTGNKTLHSEKATSPGAGEFLD